MKTVCLLLSFVLFQVSCNNKEIGIEIPGLPGPAGVPGETPNFSFQFEKYVDANNGKDDTSTGSPNFPYKTISAALNSITDASSSNRYSIILASGVDSEPAINWKPFVSLIGRGKDASLILNDINYTGSANESSRMDFEGIQIKNGKFNIDVSSSLNVNFRIIDSTASVEWNGGGPYMTQNANNLFFSGSTIISAHIKDGALHCYNNMGIFSSLIVENGTSPLVEIVGGLVQGTVTLKGNAQLYTSGVYNTATIYGVSENGNTPLWSTDATSMGYATVIGSLQINGIEDLVTTIISDLIVSTQNIILANAIHSPITITLPNAVFYLNKTITIKKKDSSSNIITLAPTLNQTIDGMNSLVLTNPYQEIKLVSDGTNWAIIGN